MAPLIIWTTDELFREKMPDAIIQIKGRKWPSIVLETGYSESLDGLSHGTDILLDILGGRI